MGSALTEEEEEEEQLNQGFTRLAELSKFIADVCNAII